MLQQLPQQAKALRSRIAIAIVMIILERDDIINDNKTDLKLPVLLLEVQLGWQKLGED